MSKTRFGIGEVLAVLLFLLGIGIQLRWPDQKGLGSLFIGLGVVFGVGLIIWVIAQRHALRSVHSESHLSEAVPVYQLEQRQTLNAPINNSPVFAPVFAPSLSQDHTTAKLEAKPTTEPVFECREVTTRRYALDTRTGELIRDTYHTGEPYSYIRFVDAILAKFYYRPDVGVDPRLRLHAHIFIFEIDPMLTLTSAPPKSKVEVYKPIWDDDEPHISHEFSAGYTHDLIVALVPVDGELSTVIGYEYETRKVPTYTGTEREFTPRLLSLEGKHFRIRVDLIPKRFNEVRCTLPPFWIAVSLETSLRVGLIGPAPSKIKTHYLSDLG